MYNNDSKGISMFEHRFTLLHKLLSNLAVIIFVDPDLQPALLSRAAFTVLLAVIGNRHQLCVKHIPKILAELLSHSAGVSFSYFTLPYNTMYRDFCFTQTAS